MMNHEVLNQRLPMNRTLLYEVARKDGLSPPISIVVVVYRIWTICILDDQGAKAESLIERR